MKDNHVAIVGAGIGGISTGIQLLMNGYSVDIYEKNSTPGGVLKSIASPDGAFRFDESASILINPQTYRNFFKLIGLDFDEYFSSIDLPVLYNVYFSNGKQLNIPKKISSLKSELSESDYNEYSLFVKTFEKKYQLSKNTILSRPFLNLKSITSLNFIKSFIKLHTFSSSKSYIDKNIHSNEINEIIKFQSFFMGVPLKELPNIYTSIAANTQQEGIDHIGGGLAYFVQTLCKIFQEKGGRIFYNSPVQRIKYIKDKASGIVVSNTLINYNNIIVNTDYLYSQKKLLKRLVIRPYNSSCSVFIIHLGLNKKYPQLNVHNLFIGESLQEEIENISKGELPSSPSMYIYSPSCMDRSFTENLNHAVMNIMVRVPNLKALPLPWDEIDQAYMYKSIMSSLSKIPALKNIKENIEYASFTTPKDFQKKYNCHYGSCFGLSHSFFQSMIFRPQVRDKKIKNLYYTGTSIHPGNGASIVLEGSTITANALN